MTSVQPLREGPAERVLGLSGPLVGELPLQPPGHTQLPRSAGFPKGMRGTSPAPSRGPSTAAPHSPGTSFSPVFQQVHGRGQAPAPSEFPGLTCF